MLKERPALGEGTEKVLLILGAEKRGKKNQFDALRIVYTNRR